MGLRSAFDCPVANNSDKKYLPDEVLWRQKEQFSDGVGYSWIDGIKEYADKTVSDDQLANAMHRFPKKTPKTKEAYLYRDLFTKHFGTGSAVDTVVWQDSIACSSPAALRWDESFKNRNDASGRAVLGIHEKAYTEDWAAEPEKGSKRERKASSTKVKQEKLAEAESEL